MTIKRITNVARARGRDKSRPYSIVVLLLLAFLLASCGDSSTPAATPGPPITIGDLPAYPNMSAPAATADANAFPQQGQYDSVQAISFSTPDDSTTIRNWYKQQLTPKGWMVVADAPNLLGLTPADRSKLIELFISSGSNSTRVLAYYASGRKATPTP